MPDALPDPLPVPVYVLSLASESVRRQAVSAEFFRFGLDFDFVDAIDGRGPAGGQLACHYDGHLNARSFKRPLSATEIACALGHRAIWRRIAEGAASVALVCEDDLSLSAAFGDFIQTVACRQAAFADVMIKLDSPARPGEAVGSLAGVELVLTRRLPAFTTGYLLGRNAAAVLLARAAAVSRPIDMDLKHYWEHRVPILLARPQLVSVRPDVESSLAASRLAVKPAGAWRRLARNLRYQLAMSHGRLRSPLRVDRMPALLAMRDLLSEKG